MGSYFQKSVCFDLISRITMFIFQDNVPRMDFPQTLKSERSFSVFPGSQVIKMTRSAVFPDSQVIKMTPSSGIIRMTHSSIFPGPQLFRPTDDPKFMSFVSVSHDFHMFGPNSISSLLNTTDVPTNTTLRGGWNRKPHEKNCVCRQLP